MDRFLLLLALVAVMVAGWALIRLWRVWKVRRLQDDTPLTDLAPAGQPAVIAFSTPQCAECRTRQAPALARLSRIAGGAVTIRSVSALEHLALAERLGVLTVPATVIVDRRGHVRQVNLGYASEDQLMNQLRSAQAA